MKRARAKPWIGTWKLKLYGCTFLINCVIVVVVVVVVVAAAVVDWLMMMMMIF